MLANAENNAIAGIELPDTTSYGLDELFYYIAFALYLLATALQKTMFETFLGLQIEEFVDIAQVAILILLLSKIIIQRATIKEWLLSLAIVAVYFVSWRQSGEGRLFWLALFVVCGQGVNIKTLAKNTFWETLTILTVVILFSQIGLLEDYTLARSGGFVRHSLGFAHPNNLGLYLFVLCVSFSAMRFGRNPFPDLLLLAVSFFMNLLITDSRSSALLCIFQGALILVFYKTHSVKSRLILSRLFIVLVFLIAAASFYFMVCYDATNLLMGKLDTVLSGRLSLSNGYYKIGGLTPFGQTFASYEPIAWQDGEPVPFLVDNGYVHMLLRSGLIPTAIFFGSYFALLLKTVKEGRWNYLLFALVLMGAFSFVEQFGICIESNYFLVAIALEILFGKNKACSDTGKVLCVNQD